MHEVEYFQLENYFQKSGNPENATNRRFPGLLHKMWYFYVDLEIYFTRRRLASSPSGVTQAVS